jgi:hypothetical protein
VRWKECRIFVGLWSLGCYFRFQKSAVLEGMGFWSAFGGDGIWGLESGGGWRLQPCRGYAQCK